ncbi:MAG TPA: UDP-N-acetylglucosamine 2-epimerase (non-hydrolyzing) [Woeseiaceae bacterium]|nr:UDP-N-acetylglucosamine 2-epimerase (non-hydrolyzing) [Woeseiaceae bacterium]
MRTVSIVGARPQFVKLAPVSRAMSCAQDQGRPAIEDFIVHTGQHYDPGLSDIFFSELDIPAPGIDLNIGSGAHGEQTARMLQGIERVLLDIQPDMVVIYGDTNSTLAGALAASKLHIPIAHIEAGLRSFDRAMPEEINRVVSDHVSDILFAPTTTAMENLGNEHLSDRSILVGDVMLDAIRFNSSLSLLKSKILDKLQLEGQRYGVATLHRAANTDSGRLRLLLDSLNRVASDYLPVVFPVHPRTVARISTECPDWKPGPRLMVVDPVGYLDMIRLTEIASVVLTDSGGLQKEAFFLNTPCITLRDETEWPETVDGGGNILVGTSQDKIHQAVGKVLSLAADGDSKPSFSAEKYFGDGDAAGKIVAEIADFLSR